MYKHSPLSLCVCFKFLCLHTLNLISFSFLAVVKSSTLVFSRLLHNKLLICPNCTFICHHSAGWLLGNTHTLHTANLSRKEAVLRLQTEVYVWCVCWENSVKKLRYHCKMRTLAACFAVCVFCSVHYCWQTRKAKKIWRKERRNVQMIY